MLLFSCQLPRLPLKAAAWSMQLMTTGRDNEKKILCRKVLQILIYQRNVESLKKFYNISKRMHHHVQSRSLTCLWTMLNLKTLFTNTKLTHILDKYLNI